MYYLFTYFLYLYTAFLGPKTKRLYKITILFEEQILNEADQKGRLFAVMQNKHKTLFYNFYKNIKVIKQGGKKRAGHNLKWKYVESTSLGENERSVKRLVLATFLRSRLNIILLSQQVVRSSQSHSMLSALFLLKLSIHSITDWNWCANDWNLWSRLLIKGKRSLKSLSTEQPSNKVVS